MKRLRIDTEGPVLAVHAGTVAYGTAMQWQRALVRRRAEEEIGDLLLTLEHPPVYTAGKNAHDENLLWDAEEREARGIEFFPVDRGGDVTYHGPGQLVAYPLVRLAGIRGVVDYVRQLEEVCIRVAADFGVQARPVDGLTGVWVGDEKLVAIGVRVNHRGVTSHGLAFNVTTDLSHFGGIVPCGIADRGVCSLASLGVDATVDEVLERFRSRFPEVVGGSVEPAGPDALDGLLHPTAEPPVARSAS